MLALIVSGQCVFQVAECHAAPEGFCPSLGWQRQQVGHFSDVRQVR